jgi:hypothetical protein
MSLNYEVWSILMHLSVRCVCMCVTRAPRTQNCVSSGLWQCVVSAVATSVSEKRADEMVDTGCTSHTFSRFRSLQNFFFIQNEKSGFEAIYNNVQS